MRKAVFKDFIRNIKGSLGRFFAIMAIVAIGVAFFAGVTASSGDMKHSSDSYYDEYNMNDIRILSSIGFTSQDIEAVSKVYGVKAVYKTNTHDVLVDYDGRENVAHISGIPVGKASDDDSYINQLRIKEGRLPQMIRNVLLSMKIHVSLCRLAMLSVLSQEQRMISMTHLRIQSIR
mgnify:CR=1 FL=1